MALARWQRNIVTDAGIIVPGASVEVRRESDNGLASLFSDRAGASAILNPFLADSVGFAAFHVVGGAYKITVTSGSFTKIWRYVGVGLTQEFDVDQLSITYANLPDMNDATVLGRNFGGGSGDPIALTAAQLQAVYNSIGGSLFGPTRALTLSTTPFSIPAANSGQLVVNFNATRTVNLPAQSLGLCYGFVHVSTGSLTLSSVAGGGNIVLPDSSSVTSVVLSATAGTSVVLVSDGSNWIAFASEINRITATTTDRGVVEFATAAEYRANTPLRGLDNQDVWSAADLVGLTDAATIAVDMSLGFNFSVTLAGNRTLGNPTNTKNGQSGIIAVTQDGTGSRTLGYSANWDFAAGAPFTLSTTIGAVDILSYFVRSATSIVMLGISKAIA